LVLGSFKSLEIKEPLVPVFGKFQNLRTSSSGSFNIFRRTSGSGFFEKFQRMAVLMKELVV
jgi:hypothetical protein